VEFRLLGPVEAWTRDRRLDLGPRKQRLVLAVLALKVNQLVDVDRLVDLTWPDAPPQTARHAIHVRVSQLRAVLAKAGADRDGVAIATHGTSYALRADPTRIDAHRFRALVGAALAHSDDGERVGLLRRALALWRGTPMADVSAAVAEPLWRGLDELRLTALEEWLDAELRLGQHGAIIEELTEFAAQHPYRQRLLAQLMLALYRAGRAPDALAAFRAARRRLREEFGLDPEPQLRRLESAILSGDPALDLPAPRLPATSLSVARRHSQRWHRRRPGAALIAPTPIQPESYAS
jgi:DNA-binding SARP family transcriptional activator